MKSTLSLLLLALLFIATISVSHAESVCPADFVFAKREATNLRGRRKLDITFMLPPQPDEDHLNHRLPIEVIEQKGDYVVFHVHNSTWYAGEHESQRDTEGNVFPEDIFTSYGSGPFLSEHCIIVERLAPLAPNSVHNATCNDASGGGKIAIIRTYARFSGTPASSGSVMVPKCCHDPTPDNTDLVVEYIFEVFCEPTCDSPMEMTDTTQNLPTDVTAAYLLVEDQEHLDTIEGDGGSDELGDIYNSQGYTDVEVDTSDRGWIDEIVLPRSVPERSMFTLRVNSPNSVVVHDYPNNWSAEVEPNTELSVVEHHGAWVLPPRHVNTINAPFPQTAGGPPPFPQGGMPPGGPMAGGGMAGGGAPPGGPMAGGGMAGGAAPPGGPMAGGGMAGGGAPPGGGMAGGAAPPGGPMAGGGMAGGAAPPGGGMAGGGMAGGAAPPGGPMAGGGPPPGVSF